MFLATVKSFGAVMPGQCLRRYVETNLERGVAQAHKSLLFLETGARLIQAWLLFAAMNVPRRSLCAPPGSVS